MKKIMSVCLIFGLVVSLCACASGQEPAEAACGHEAYSDLIARLEAKDFDGARSLIDAMEGPTATEPSATSQEEPLDSDSASIDMIIEEMGYEPLQKEDFFGDDSKFSLEIEISPDLLQKGDTVELTQYNVNDYFEFVDDYLIAERSSCNQYIVLKEEYADRLISAENVRIDVSYLMTNAYGEIDMKAEEFKSEYFDITSKQRLSDTLELDRNNTAWIAQPTYSNRKGCFQDFVMDVEIESGSGTLVFSES